jgi:DNA-directed RNA polymerase specialized sigma24 family protein
MATPAEEAFDRLLPYAYNAGWVLLRDEALAQEVATETMARLLHRWTRLADRPRLEAWVVDEATEVALELGDGDGVSIVAALSRRRRRVFMHRFAFGLDEDETAAVTGLSAGAVRRASEGAALTIRDAAT